MKSFVIVLLILKVVEGVVSRRFGKTFSFLSPLSHDTCNLPNQSYVGRYANREMLLDEKHHIVMDWTPKAACTKMVEMFWNEMNITRGVFYPHESFVHNYRTDFYEKCGRVDPDIFNSDAYYKFKVVRNPFDRAVSSYIHLMKTNIMPFILDGGSTHTNMRNISDTNEFERWKDMSFEELLEFYLTRVLMERRRVKLQNVALYHFVPQFRPEEWDSYRFNTTPVFDHIVHLETFEQDIAVVNKATGRNYSYPIGFDAHVVGKIEKDDTYQGDKPYHYFVENGVPSKYEKFYNAKSERLVEEIFARDLKIYGYKFPYDRFYR